MTPSRIELIRRICQGAILSAWSAMRVSAVAEPLAIIMGQHVRVGNEDNLWNSKRERIMTIGVWYDSVEETLQQLGFRDGVLLVAFSRELSPVGHTVSNGSS